ncbi:uncharacterized protein LOC119050234 [Artibeus jamaicensis]|uniref:uncharacterized protein LOC119050234 n=1 Tax=Artibeus jamaicensis TaxID=9417 RepID=UPI00235B06C0|nr:uncharacterized protein LOC119050234 [Artibeus jamaicensis]
MRREPEGVSRMVSTEQSKQQSRRPAVGAGGSGHGILRALGASGAVGLFQVLQVISLLLPSVFVPSQMLLDNFSVAAPGHCCWAHMLDNGSESPSALTPEVLRVTSTPPGPNHGPHQCHRFRHPQWQLLDPNATVTNWSEAATEPCVDGWVYDGSTFTSTIVAEVGASPHPHRSFPPSWPPGDGRPPGTGRSCRLQHCTPPTTAATKYLCARSGHHTVRTKACHICHLRAMPLAVCREWRPAHPSTSVTWLRTWGPHCGWPNPRDPAWTSLGPGPAGPRPLSRLSPLLLFQRGLACERQGLKLRRGTPGAVFAPGFLVYCSLRFFRTFGLAGLFLTPTTLSESLARPAPCAGRWWWPKAAMHGSHLHGNTSPLRGGEDHAERVTSAEADNYQTTKHFLLWGRIVTHTSFTSVTSPEQAPRAETSFSHENSASAEFDEFWSQQVPGSGRTCLGGTGGGDPGDKHEGPRAWELSSPGPRWLPKSTRRLISAGKPDRAPQELKKVARINGVKDARKTLTREVLMSTVEEAASARARQLLLDLLRMPILWRRSCYLSTVSFSLAISFFRLVYDLQSLGGDSFLLQVLFGALDFLGRAANNFLLKFFGCRLILTSSQAKTGPSILASMLVPQNFQSLWVVLAVLGKGRFGVCLTRYPVYKLFPTSLRLVLLFLPETRGLPLPDPTQAWRTSEGFPAPWEWAWAPSDLAGRGSGQGAALVGRAAPGPGLPWG